MRAPSTHHHVLMKSEEVRARSRAMCSADKQLRLICVFDLCGHPSSSGSAFIAFASVDEICVSASMCPGIAQDESRECFVAQQVAPEFSAFRGQILWEIKSRGPISDPFFHEEVLENDFSISIPHDRYANDQYPGVNPTRPIFRTFFDATGRWASLETDVRFAGSSSHHFPDMNLKHGTNNTQGMVSDITCTPADLPFSQ